MHVFLHFYYLLYLSNLWMFKPFKKLLANDAKIIEPYEQEFGHVDYLAIRSTNESGWDTCSACYFRQSSKIILPIKKKNVSVSPNSSVGCSLC